MHPGGRCARWRLGGQPQTCKDAGDHGGHFDSCDEFQLSAAVRALRDVDIEHPLQQLRATSTPFRAADRRVGATACVPRGGTVSVGTGTTAFRSFSFGACTP